MVTACLSSQLDLFKGPCKQVSMEKNTLVPHFPVTTITGNGPLEFTVPASPMYTDLSDTRLYLKCKLVDTAGNDLAGGHEVAPVNMVFHALFRKVDVYLNNQLITQSNDLYPFKAGFETLLNYGEGAKESQLASGIFFHKDKADAAGNANLGYTTRRDLTQASREFELMGPLHVDLFFQEKYLLDNVPMRIVLTRSNPNFYLQASSGDPGAKIVIQQAILYVRRVQVSPAVLSAHAKALAHCNAIYPIHKTEMELLTIPRGSSVLVRDGLFGSKVPKRLVLAVLTGNSLNGGYQDSPFRYVTNVVKRVDITLDGEPVGDTPINCDFSQGQYLRAYLNMFSAINKSYADHSIDITYRDFGYCYPIFCFDLTSDSCGNTTEHFELERKGNMRLLIGLENVVTPLYVICYAEFEGNLEITKTREIKQ